MYSVCTSCSAQQNQAEGGEAASGGYPDAAKARFWHRAGPVLAPHLGIVQEEKAKQAKAKEDRAHRLLMMILLEIRNPLKMLGFWKKLREVTIARGWHGSIWQQPVWVWTSGPRKRKKLPKSRRIRRFGSPVDKIIDVGDKWWELDGNFMHFSGKHIVNTTFQHV